MCFPFPSAGQERHRYQSSTPWEDLTSLMLSSRSCLSRRPARLSRQGAERSQHSCRALQARRASALGTQEGHTQHRPLLGSAVPVGPVGTW